MKKILILSMTVFTLLNISSCKKTKDAINKLTEFDMPYSSDFTVPATSVTVNVPVDLTTPDVQTNASTTFANQKTATDKITEIKLTKLTMVASTGNFNYLKTIIIYIQAPGQAEMQIASQTNVPDGLTSLNMDLNDVNLKNYVSGSTFKFRINVLADGTVPADQPVKLNETMHVKASLLD